MLILDLLSLRSSRPVTLALGLFLGLVSALHAQTAEVRGTMPEDYYPSLKAIMDVALKQSPQMLARNIDLAQAAANRYLSDSALWPNLSGNTSYSYNNSRVATKGVASGPASESTGLGYGLSFSQPLFQWGALKYRSDISKLSQKITERQYADAYRLLVSSLRSQYLSLIAKKVALRNSRDQIAIMKKGLAVQEANLKEGALSEGELISPRLLVQEYELFFDRAVQDYELSKSSLVRISGYTELTEEKIPAEIVRPVYTTQKRDELMGAFRRGGVDNTLQGQIYVMSLKQRDLDYKIARTGLLPKFSLGAGYSTANSAVPTGQIVVQSFTTSYNYSVSGNWTFFDGFATRGAKLSALATKRATERQYQNYVDATIDQAEAAQKQLEFSSRSLELAEVRRALAEDAVKRSKQDLTEGTTSQAVVDSNQGSFYQTDLAVVNARLDLMSRWAEYVALVSVDPALDALPSRYLNYEHGK